MRIAILTNEYPPHVYGGAGVHVEYLTRELAALDNGKHIVDVLCFGEQKEHFPNRIVDGIQPSISLPSQGPRNEKLMDTLLRNLIMTGTLRQADVIHCHTWYTHLAGCLLKELLGRPLILTTHSLEPHRPWKADQLGSGYNVSKWVEKTAYQNADGVIAVSKSMKRDVRDLYGVVEDRIQVIYNGIDTDQYKPRPDPELLLSYGINPDKPIILFVGRVTKQKGIIYLIKSIKYILPSVQVVLCAGSPDTEEIGMETAEMIEVARRESENDIVWITSHLPKRDIISLYTHADVFVCPSIYEPFGIINLEAMACGTPVVGSSVGGITEVVVDGETGLLVPFEHAGEGEFEPKDPERFSRDIASAVNTLLMSREEIHSMALKARKRVEEYFSWTSIARQTIDFYRDVIEKANSRTTSS